MTSTMRTMAEGLARLFKARYIRPHGYFLDMAFIQSRDFKRGICVEINT